MEISWKKINLYILKSYLDERLEIKLLHLSQFLPLFPVWLHYKAVSTICLWIFLLICPWCFFYEISLGPEFAEQSYLPRSQCLYGGFNTSKLQIPNIGFLTVDVCLGPIDSSSSQRTVQRTLAVLHFKPKTSSSRAWVCTHHSLPFSFPPFFYPMK